MAEWYIASRKQMAEDIAIKSLVLDQVSNMVVIHDHEGRIIYVNQTFCDFYRADKQKAMSCNIREYLIGEDSEEELCKRIRDVRLNGQLRFEWKMRDKTGEVRHYEVSSRVVGINGGKAVLSVFHDVTERKAYEDYLHSMVLKYRSLLENVTDWVWKINEDLEVVYSNQRINCLLGYGVEEIVGEKITRPELLAMALRQVFTELWREQHGKVIVLKPPNT